jgi:Holliday junction resolvasome RuvABC endonuclease subunit
MCYLRFKRMLSEIQNSVSGLDAVYFEEVVAHTGAIAAQTYGAFSGHLIAWCEERNIPYLGVPVGTIKKDATGKGNAGKELMIEAAKAKGHIPWDDNEADAICLLYYVLKLNEAA